jgi:hypothetical protein
VMEYNIIMNYKLFTVLKKCNLIIQIVTRKKYEKFGVKCINLLISLYVISLILRINISFYIYFYIYYKKNNWTIN